MLNRRYLRIKVLQTLYAWFQSDSDDLAKAEKEMFKSINQVYDLYLLMLLLVVDVFDSGRDLIETKKKKKLATDADLNPNMHFANNKAICLLEDNVEFKRGIEAKKLNWAIHSDVVRKLYRTVESSPEYAKYMEVEESGLKKDKGFIVEIYRKYFCDNEIFEQLIEERSIYWPLDLDLVHMAVMKTFEKMKLVQDQNSKILLDIYRDKEDDVTFVKELLRKSLVKNPEYSEVVAKYTSNWEVDRLATIDTILIKMALTELENMKTIPIKVSMNEYIDLSKYFSTPKSKNFINGILDRVVSDWKKEGRIQKVGAGLIE